MARFELGLGSVDRDGEALHLQLAEAMRTRILDGEWHPGHRLPPEPALAAEVGVSRGTLRRSLAALTDEGLLTQVQGRGTFVAAASALPIPTPQLSTLSEDILREGGQLVTRVLECAIVPAPAEIARTLRLRDGAPIARIVRVRSTADGPIALLHNYVVDSLAPDLTEVDFTRETLFGVLEKRYRLSIGGARRRFSAVGASESVATELGLEIGAAVQFLDQLTVLTDGRPVEYSEVWIDSARLRVVVHLTRDRADDEPEPAASRANPPETSTP